MKRIKVNLGDRSYPIIVNAGLKDKLGEFIQSSKTVVISSPIIAELYGDVLESLNHEYHLVLVPDGEEAKTWSSVEKVLGDLLEYGLDRQSTILALGGGSVGDLAGFIASIYMRGIDVVQIPTTLLAMVDSSIGGKTAVNHPMGKNLVGCFHQPSTVLIDPTFLSSLPLRQIRSGLAEVAKYGVISDDAIFNVLEETPVEDLKGEIMVDLIAKCATVKAGYVQRDERDVKGIRAALNYGHTLGHAVESLSNHHINHGEGVSIGMNVAAHISVSLENCGPELVKRQTELLDSMGLPTKVPDMPISDLIQVMHRDKKAEGNKIRFVLPRGLGVEPVLRYVPDMRIKSALKELQ